MSFKNCQIVAVDYPPLKYHEEPIPRGDKAYMMSSSRLRLFASCPSRWVRPIVKDGKTTYYEHKESKATKWGNLFDTRLFFRETFQEHYAIRPAEYETEVLKCPECGKESDAKNCMCTGRRTPREEETVKKPWNKRAEFCAEWEEKAEAKGLVVVDVDELQRVDEAIKRFREDRDIADFIDESQKQVYVTGEWHDPGTGIVVPCQCLIDLVPTSDSRFRRGLGDVKTSKNAGPAWRAWAHQVGYEIQAAWNIDMFGLAAPERELLRFNFLLSENYPPWEPAKKYMEQDILNPMEDIGDIAEGRRQYRKMMEDYCRCLSTGVWPGYDDHTEAISGWTLIQADPFQAMRRMEAPKRLFGDEAPEEPEPNEEPEPENEDVPV